MGRSLISGPVAKLSWWEADGLHVSHAGVYTSSLAQTSVPNGCAWMCSETSYTRKTQSITQLQLL